MSERDDYRLQGHVAVCRFCGRVKEGTAHWALEHYRLCVSPREEAKRLFGDDAPSSAPARAKRVSG